MILSVYRVDIEDMFDGDFAVGVTFINWFTFNIWYFQQGLIHI